MSTPATPDQWTARDQALLRTAQIMYAIEHAEYDRIVEVPVNFAVSGSYPDNKIVLSAPFTLHSFQAMGDGSYWHESGFFLSSSTLAVGAFLAAEAIGNSSRRNAAANAATPRWHTIDAGIVFVNQYGFYLRTATNLLWWNWESILEGQLIAPGQFALLGQSDNRGRVNYVISSDAAELLFAFWATVRQPQHLQMRQRAWLIPSWFEKYRAVFGAQAFDFVGGRDGSQDSSESPRDQ